jgi:formamidopyrimidine-DNA glycosylase
LQKLTEKYGLDPLEKSVTPEKFLKAVKSKRTNIKNVLMDQKIMSGIGNIYATDALFLAGINPLLPTQNMSLEMAEKMLSSVRDVLTEGIKNRGSTLPDKMYVDIFGKTGNQQNHFKVYLKTKCTNCGSSIKFIKINGRGSYFCPTCQPLEISKNTNSNQKKLL